MGSSTVESRAIRTMLKAGCVLGDMGSGTADLATDSGSDQYEHRNYNQDHGD